MKSRGGYPPDTPLRKKSHRRAGGTPPHPPAAGVGPITIRVGGDPRHPPLIVAGGSKSPPRKIQNRNEENIRLGGRPPQTPPNVFADPKTCDARARPAR